MYIRVALVRATSGRMARSVIHKTEHDEIICSFNWSAPHNRVVQIYRVKRRMWNAKEAEKFRDKSWLMPILRLSSDKARNRHHSSATVVAVKMEQVERGIISSSDVDSQLVAANLSISYLGRSFSLFLDCLRIFIQVQWSKTVLETSVWVDTRTTATSLE